MTYYRFTIKSSETVRRIQFKSQWFECEEFIKAIEKRDEYLINHPEIDGKHCRWEEKQRLGRGGARPGAGTKSPHKGGRKKGRGKWNGQETTITRIPKQIANNLETILRQLETIEKLIQDWELKTENATEMSKTGKSPRTYDKAKQLIQQLKEELNM